MPQLPANIATKFYATLGAFHASWSALDLSISCAIGQLLKISDRQAHVLTAGLEFGRKAQLFRNLYAGKDDPKKAKILGALGKVQKESEVRNAITHGIISRSETMVSFTLRSRGGQYKAISYNFTYDNLVLFVKAFLDAAVEMDEALGFTLERIHRFALAASKTAKKSSKSPDAPSSRAHELLPNQSRKATSKRAARSKSGK